MMTKVREFLASDLFNIILLVFAAVIIVVDQMLGTPVYYGFAIIFGFISFIVLLLTDDVVSLLCPALLELSFVIQYKNSFEPLIKYIYLAPILVIILLIHIVAYRKRFTPKKPSELKLFWPIAAASVAMMLGGVGIMTFVEYTAKINLVNAIMLGPFILLLYWLFSGLIGEGKNYTSDMTIRISKVMATVSVFLIFAVFEYYWENWATFIKDPNILPFQWRNNACTVLIIAMPFLFLLAKRKHIAYLLIAIFSCVAIVLSGSRGGLIFGAIEFLILIIYYAKTDKGHRKVYLSILALGFVVAGGICIKFSSLIRYTIDRFTSYKENYRRLGLWQRSLEDFKANPLFGRGIGYLGNRDLHPSKTGALCWYHSSLPQVWGSMGAVGLLAYGYQFVERLKFLLKGEGELKRTVFFSFLGLEMMSLVNPGIFAPAYLIIITILFVIVEQYEK